MKKTRDLIIFFIMIILLSTPVFTVYYVFNNKPKSDSAEDRYVIEFLNNSYRYMTEDELNSVYLEIQNISETAEDEIAKGKAEFLLANIDAESGDFEKAFNEAEESLKNLKSVDSLCNDKTAVKAKIGALYYLSMCYEFMGEFKKAAETYEDMRILSEKADMISLYIKFAGYRAGDVYNARGASEESLVIMHKCIEKAKEINYPDMYDLYQKLGSFYNFDQNYVEGVNFKLKALEELENKKITPDSSLYKAFLEIKLSIGNDYIYLRNYKMALKYVYNVLNDPVILNPENADMFLVANLSMLEIYINTEDIENCEKYYDETIKASKRSDTISLSTDTVIAANIYKAKLKQLKGETEKALKILNEAKEEFEKKAIFSYYNFDIMIEYFYGDIYLAQGKYKKAIEHHLNTLERAETNGLSYLSGTICDKIAESFIKLNDQNNAYQYLQRGNKIRENQILDNSTEYSQYLITEFESNKKDVEIQILESEKNRRNIIIGTFGAAFLVVIIAAIILSKKNTEIKKLNKKLYNIGQTDGLTKLYNRRALKDYLESLWKKNNKKDFPLSVIMLDIDYFKKYNDNYGHPEGDFVLETVARYLKGTSSQNEFIARYGGEEFIIVMPGAGENAAQKRAEKIISAVKKAHLKHEYSEIADYVTLSIGGATVYNNSGSLEQIIKNADAALYKSKENGRNRYTHF